MQDLIVTLIQSDLVWENKPANLSNFEAKIKAIDHNTDLIVLPEMFNTGFSMAPEKWAELPLAETYQWMAKMSKLKNAYLAGSYMVKERDSYYNRFILMRPDGSFQQYDKRHLFRMGYEPQHFAAGDQALVFEIKGWKIKALICYDLRFPVFARNHYQQGEYEYDILLFVANWPQVRSHIWEALLVARAIENQAYVVGVNRIGADGNALEHSGNSCVLNAKGQYLIKPIVSQEAIVSTQLSYSDLYQFRDKFTFGLDWDHFELK